MECPREESALEDTKLLSLLQQAQQHSVRDEDGMQKTSKDGRHGLLGDGHTRESGTGSSLAKWACSRDIAGKSPFLQPFSSSDLSSRNRLPIAIRCGDRADVAFACS